SVEALARAMLITLDLDEAEPLVARALELAEVDGSARARASVLRLRAWVESLRGDDDAAAATYAEEASMFADLGQAAERARARVHLGRLLLARGDAAAAERELRESVATLRSIGDRGFLCEAQRSLAQALVAQGRVEEA